MQELGRYQGRHSGADIDTAVSMVLEGNISRAQSNWIQDNEAAADYIKNRPMYRVLVKLLDGTYVTEDVGDGKGRCDISAGVLPIKVGKTYLVVFEGKEYTCEAYASSASSGIINIGNEQVTTGEGVEPFLLWTFEGVYDVLITRVPGTYRLELYEQSGIKQLDEAYIPDTIARTADIPAQVQSDWNQNNSAAKDYVKNRPFYHQLLLPDVSMNASEMPGLSVFLPGEFQQIAKNYGFHLEDGLDYAVNYDGVLYSLKAFVCTYSNSSAEVVTIGNPELLLLSSPGSNISVPDGAGTDAPFVFWYNGNNAGMYCKTGGIHSFTVSEVAKLSNEYLEDGVVYPDWNQNDETAAGYIKNRPFYTESGSAEVFPETTVQIEGDMYWESDPTQTVEKLTAGETYTINWNGTVHEVVCREQEVPDLELEGFWKTFEVDGYEQFIAFGYNDSSRTEPGVIIVYSGFGDGEFTVSISAGLEGEVVHKLDNKFLNLTAEEWTFELEDGSTLKKRVMLE